MIPSIADACALIDWYRGAARTTATLQRHFAHPTHGTLVITTTIWEIALETSSGKLESIIAPGFASIGSMLRTGATVLTNDRLIARHGVPVLW